MSDKRENEPANSQPLPGDTEYEDILKAPSNDVGDHDHNYVIVNWDTAPDEFHVYHGTTKVTHYHDGHYHTHMLTFDYGPAVYQVPT